MKMRNNECWYSVLEKQPLKDGIYYAYISNNQIGDEIKKVNYKDGKWNIKLDEYESIIAWKVISSEKVKDKEKWLLNHKKEIKDAFHLKTVKINCFEISETLVECICEYGWFMNSGLVQYIDGIYVIRIL